jgi:myo-inositol-1-phosphate synthase
MTHRKIKVAIAGIGNCAAALVQGVEYYRSAAASGAKPVGLMTEDVDGYRVGDIEFVAAFDIDTRKVGQRLGDAIFALPNNTKRFHVAPCRSHVVVEMGPVLDGVPQHMHNYPADQRFIPAAGDAVDVVASLRSSGAHVLVSYMPVGAEQATKFYAQCALDAGVGFINCVPVLIASDAEWAAKFRERRLPVIGDDIKSQLGATVLHRALARLFEMRGVRIDSTYQLNTGGNTDFLNMLSRERLDTKRQSKTQSVQSQLENPVDPAAIHIGPSDYVPFLRDNKVAFIRLEGSGFGGVPMNLELRLSVEDSPNSAGVVVDAIRAAKVAMDRGLSGPIHPACAWCMKHPPVQMSDEEAQRAFAESVAKVESTDVPLRSKVS